MAFTNPKTWSFGEVLTSTDMNLYVRDNTADLDARIPAGIGPNVVQVVKTNTFTMASTTFTAVTGLSASITPTSTDSKILVLVNMSGHGTANSSQPMSRLMRDSTAIAIADAEGVRIQNTTQFGFSPSGNGLQQSSAFMFLDAPNTDVSVTYSVQIRSTGGTTVFVNRTEADANGTTTGRSISAITLIEVKA